jgi:hypothetical protein
MSHESRSADRDELEVPNSIPPSIEIERQFCWPHSEASGAGKSLHEGSRVRPRHGCLKRYCRCINPEGVSVCRFASLMHRISSAEYEFGSCYDRDQPALKVELELCLLQ